MICGNLLQMHDQGLIDNLNALPEALIARARELGNFHDARSLLSARTTAASTPYLSAFVREVVFRFRGRLSLAARPYAGTGFRIR